MLQSLPIRAILIFLLLGSICRNADCQTFEIPDGIRLEAEADDFIDNMPDGQQDRQTDAIHHALRGDFSDLLAVRKSRDIPITPSPGVAIRDFIIDRSTSVGITSSAQVKARLYRPAHTDSPLPLLVYLHGGGWSLGSINSCARFCDSLASSGKALVLAPEYRLAPEYPSPAAVADALAALSFAAAHAEEWGTNADRISIGGDSSGGNIAIAAALAATADSTMTQPKSLVLFYPVVKAYADKSDSWKRYGKGYALDSRLMDAFCDAWLSQATDSSLASPADLPDSMLSRLPATLLVAAERDILCDQGKDFMTRLSDIGVPSHRIVLPKSVHLFITVDGQPSAFKAAVEATEFFLDGPKACSK